MKPIANDADGKRDYSISFWWGVVWLGLVAVMYASNIGDEGLWIFFALTGIVPLVLGYALTPRRP